MKKMWFAILVFLILIIPVKAVTEIPLDVTNTSIKTISTFLDQGIITSVDLVNVYLERIKKYDNNFNSIIYLNDDAIKEAEELDKLRSAGNIKGPLHGIPLVVKANIDVKGIPTTAGSLALYKNYPKSDAYVVQKLKEAGAIIIGTTNMSRFAFSAASSSSDYGTVRNAYNTKHSAYGSSGGSAVAVSLSFAAGSLGTDTNSSIRVPASTAGVIGFRPTYNLINKQGIIPYDYYRDVVGPITKTVSDSALLMEVMTGTKYTDVLEKSSLKDKVIGVPTELYKGSNNASLSINRSTYSEITKMVEQRIKDMENAGAKIVYLDKFITSYYYNIDRNTLSGSTMCDAFNEYIKGSTGSIKTFYELSNIAGLGEYAAACNKTSLKNDHNLSEKNRYKKYLTKVFDDNSLDAIIYPTTKNKVGTSLLSPGSYIVAATGFTSVSMPLGLDSNDLAYGIEFLGKPNTESLLFEIINSYEQIFTMPSSKLAPSLYKIDQEITNLINHYDKILQTEVRGQKKKEIKDNLISDTKQYFKNYQSNSEKKEQALNLITRYEDLGLQEKSDEKSFTLILKVLLGIVISLIIISFVNKYLKKKKRRRRKRR